MSQSWITACPDPQRWGKRLAGSTGPAIAGGCLPWSGMLNKYGYGRFRWKTSGRRHETGAHRAAYLIHVGDIPSRLVIDHLCRNRACVNVEHMELVTVGENVRRGKVGRRERRGCSRHGLEHGYWFTTKAGKVAWICRPCRKERFKRWQDRQAG